MTEHNTYERGAPTCPHCGHEMDSDEMCAHHEDLFALAPDEGRAEIKCPDILCGKTYHVQGGYLPHYTSAIDEDEL
ncbi:hypothetical protein [Burkholderia sp.]|uniref:hypothetical protein n=1 Tax=Burkholderia sp. TaxID=36773 RepID=UPI0025C2EE87|nr:hypothetical protein [Burkholderia sp.]MBS6362806.1 hypothetical protein [Burkholderia sp.]